jgi:uncharacterized membrane protein
MDESQSLEPATDADMWTWQHAISLKQRSVRRLIARVEQERARADENFEKGDEQYRRAKTAEQAVARLLAKLESIRQLTGGWDHGDDCPFHLCDYDDNGQAISDYTGEILKDDDCNCGISQLQDALNPHK